MSYSYRMRYGKYASHVYIDQDNKQIFTLQLDYGSSTKFFIDYHYNDTWFQINDNFNDLSEEVKLLLRKSGQYMINNFEYGYTISDNALKFLKDTIES